MKIAVDENIIYGDEAFSSFGEVTLYHGREINNLKLRDKDALIVRSITNVNKELLRETPVKFVGTATIGTDHVDTDELTKMKIRFADAAGCNSHAVKEYVFSAIFSIYIKNNFNVKDKSIGIIGVGNIGSKVAEVSESLGFKVIRNDPPLKDSTKSEMFDSLENALQCDVVTLHVPLNSGGVYNTHHLLNEENLKLIKPGAILINSSRGSVIDNKALKKRLKENKNFFVALDVWENEPQIDLELLSLIDIGTPHIAGYSFEGKVNGTLMVYNALCDFLNKPKSWIPPRTEVENRIINIDTNDTLEGVMSSIFNHSYPIDKDDELLRKLLNMEMKEISSYFDSLRKNYRLRRELLNYSIENKGRYNNIMNDLRIA